MRSEAGDGLGNRGASVNIILRLLNMQLYAYFYMLPKFERLYEIFWNARLVYPGLAAAPQNVLKIK